jgi:hypothetical protein
MRHRVTTATSREVSPKVTAATIAAAVVGLLLWILDLYAFTPGVEDGVPAPVSVFLVTMGTFAAGYLTRDPKRVP